MASSTVIVTIKIYAAAAAAGRVRGFVVFVGRQLIVGRTNRSGRDPDGSPMLLVRGRSQAVGPGPRVPTDHRGPRARTTGRDPRGPPDPDGPAPLCPLREHLDCRN